MSERARIQALLDEGRINQEEADMLLEALGDVEGIEDAVSNTETVVSQGSEAVEEVIAAVHDPDIERAEQPEASTQQAKRLRPEHLNWVKINVLAGDVKVRVDSSLSEPVANGNVEIKRAGEDFEMHIVRGSEHKKEGKLLGGVISWNLSIGDLDVKVPEGYGVEIYQKAGDLNIKNVPYVMGHVLAGDVDLHDVAGIDLEMSAGDLDASLCLAAGEHRINMLAGDVDIELLEGSSCRFYGDVSIGDVDINIPYERKQRFLGYSFDAQVGESANAELEIKLKTGDLDIEARDV